MLHEFNEQEEQNRQVNRHHESGFSEGGNMGCRITRFLLTH